MSCIPQCAMDYETARLVDLVRKCGATLTIAPGVGTKVALKGEEFGYDIPINAGEIREMSFFLERIYGEQNGF